MVASYILRLCLKMDMESEGKDRVLEAQESKQNIRATIYDVIRHKEFEVIINVIIVDP